MGVGSAVDHRDGDHAALVIELDRGPARKGPVRDPDRVAPEDLPARGPLAPEAGAVKRRGRAAVDSDRECRGGGGARGLGAVDHRADRQRPGLLRVPGCRERAPGWAVASATGTHVAVAAELSWSISTTSPASDAGTVPVTDTPPRMNAEASEVIVIPSLLAVTGTLPAVTGTGGFAARARAAGACPGAARTRAAGRERQPWDRHGADGGAHQRGPNSDWRELLRAAWSVLSSLGLRGELTGSRSSVALRPCRADSPLRILGPASGSPADRPRTDDRSAWNGRDSNQMCRALCCGRPCGALRPWQAGDRVPQHAGADRQADLGELGGRLRGDPDDVPAGRGSEGSARGGVGGTPPGWAGWRRRSGRGATRVSRRRLASCGRRVASRGRRLRRGASRRALVVRSAGRSLRRARRAVARGRASVRRRFGRRGRRRLRRGGGGALIAAAVRAAMRQRAEDV